MRFPILLEESSISFLVLILCLGLDNAEEVLIQNRPGVKVSNYLGPSNDVLMAFGVDGRLEVRFLLPNLL